MPDRSGFLASVHALLLERRVSGPNWQRWPFSVPWQAHQTGKDWLRKATNGFAGVVDSHLALIRFVTEQVLDLSPKNSVSRYLMGKDPVPNGLKAWNADDTCMPYGMRTEYPHKLYLRKDLNPIEDDLGTCVSA